MSQLAPVSWKFLETAACSRVLSGVISEIQGQCEILSRHLWLFGRFKLPFNFIVTPTLCFMALLILGISDEAVKQRS